MVSPQILTLNHVWGIEIKCPASKHLKSMTEVLADKSFYLYKDNNGSIKLKKSHSYYYQFQGQMFCADLQMIDFVVWFGDEISLHVETIYFDADFWRRILPKLTYFYNTACLPEFFTRRVERGLKLYLHGGWKHFCQR